MSMTKSIQSRTLRAFGPMLILLSLAAVAHAGDGVVELNQSCAAGSGCFTGDTNGFPVTITGEAGRSYRLTGDLILPDQTFTAIVVSGNDIEIDLGGFTIQPAGCLSSPATCGTVAGGGYGIDHSASTVRGTSVENGSVVGMGSQGIRLGDHARVTRVDVHWNYVSGIEVGDGSSVTDCRVYENDRTALIGGIAAGISAGSGSTIFRIQIHQNGDEGIGAGDGVTVIHNSVYENGQLGIAAGLGSTISGNTVFRNTGRGIAASGGSTVENNTVTENTGIGIEAVGQNSVVSRNTARLNGGSGIVSSGSSLVHSNASSSNGGYGLVTGPNDGVRENVLVDNSSGPWDNTSGATDLGGNLCVSGPPVNTCL